MKCAGLFELRLFGRRENIGLKLVQILAGIVLDGRSSERVDGEQTALNVLCYFLKCMSKTKIFLNRTMGSSSSTPKKEETRKREPEGSTRGRDNRTDS